MTHRKRMLVRLLVAEVVVALAIVVIPVVIHVVYGPSGTRVTTCVGVTNSAIGSFRRHTGFYPGENTLSLLIGNGGRFTGSEVLGAALGGYPVGGPFNGKTDYVQWHEGTLVSPRGLGRPGTLSDGGRNPMPLCYYVARVSASGVETFFEEDNAPYTNQAHGGDFQKCVSRIREVQRAHPRYLLLAPGPDGLYFTEDDVACTGGE